MTKAIYFDMDGTIANLYGVENWLECLRAYDETPYENATVMLNMQVLARLLNKLQANGYHIGIISWLSKNSNIDYDTRVTQAKRVWLDKHLHSVEFNEIKIVEYGTPKEKVVDYPQGILFDDEIQNRENWFGQAFDVHNIIEILKELK